jgi:dihydrofolate reductase
MAARKPASGVARTEIVYSCAISLDGYIASTDGGVDWLHAAMVKGESYGLSEFMQSIDAVLMGSRTYEQSLGMGGGMGSAKPCWVFSRRALKAKKGIEVTSASPGEIAAGLPARGIRRAWLMGGGRLAASFLEAGLIDEIGLGVMPVVLGAGIPLFGPLGAAVPLRLVESKTYKGGALGLRYAAR